jgi:hypothetical protein
MMMMEKRLLAAALEFAEQLDFAFEHQHHTLLEYYSHYSTQGQTHWVTRLKSRQMLSMLYGLPELMKLQHSGKHEEKIFDFESLL